MAQIHSDCLVNSGRKKALLIAVKDNGVKNFHKLYNAHPDAKKLRSLLIEVFRYPEDDITLMLDDKSLSSTLWPTKRNIRKQIRLFVQGASAGDHLFFYYSGHGHQVTCIHHTETDGLDEEIYSCDGKRIMDNVLRKWLVDPLPPGCKFFALWDSCHSQTILDLDHYVCNEPEIEKRMSRWRCGESTPPESTLWQVLAKQFRRKGTPPIPRGAFTIQAYELRGRPKSRAPVSITAVSDGASPPLSKWIPFCVDAIQRVISSPSPWFKCDGNCFFPKDDDTEYARVISLGACKDNETACDDYYKGTVTQFFIDHLREKPKSTLRELLLAIRQHVDEITAARQAWDLETRVITRGTTFTTGPRIKVKTPRFVRRNTEVNAGTREKDKNEYSQQPCYSSHYPLNLDELVDL